MKQALEENKENLFFISEKIKFHNIIQGNIVCIENVVDFFPFYVYTVFLLKKLLYLTELTFIIIILKKLYEYLF